MTINKDTASGWAQLLCNYFFQTCISVLGNYFGQAGFSWKETSIGGVMFSKEEIFVELSYVPETYPTYSPTVIVGIGNEKFSVNGMPTGVPLWYVIPQDLSERKYSTWQFNSQQDLDSVMRRIQQQILDIYVMPLIKDEPKLQALIKEFSKRS